MKEELLNRLPEMVATYQGAEKAGRLSEIELAVKAMTQELGKEVRKQCLEKQDEKYPVEQRLCPCGREARYNWKRKGMVIALPGRDYYRRAYYLCASCGQGHYPLDRQLGIRAGEMSQEVIKQAALLGIQDAFGTSSQILAELTLLELSPNSIRKASLEMGTRVAQREQGLQEESQNLDTQLVQRRSAEKPRRLYGSLDGFMAHFRDGWRSG